MRTIFISFVISIFLVHQAEAQTQSQDSLWSLKQCIDYALLKNIQVQQGTLTSEINRVSVQQVKAERFPSVNASVSQNFNWNKPLDQTNMEYGDYEGSNGTNYGVNASIILFNGFKVNNTIKQKQINYQAGQMDLETTRESVSLSILEAYMQVLYSIDQVENCKNQVNSTAEQVLLAEERMKLGAVSRLDYLQIKSQLASEKSTLASAESNLAINRLSLMQLMQLPGDESFSVDTADINLANIISVNPLADSVYSLALENKPQIKSAFLNEQSAQVNIDIAKAAYYPKLMLDGGLNTSYTNKYTQLAYGTQFQNGLAPSVGLTLSIPIYQNRSAKSSVEIARIQGSSAQLNTVDTKDNLRKSIEQACLDVLSAEKQYESGLEEYNSAKESYMLAFEKFNIGLMSSVDFTVQKTNLIVAENNLLQAKYNLIFSYKTIDFYTGKPLAF